MSHGIKLLVRGEFASFNRPDGKTERISYEVMTPSAARGVVEAIYWKPEIRWVIQRIHVLKPIRFASVRRNEVASKIPAGSVRTAMQSGSGNLGIFIEEDRQQRAAMLLRDVEYVIEARFELLKEGDHPGKHLDMFNRRARQGQCFHRPYLGTREFPADFELIEGEIPPSPLDDIDRNKDLGWMLHDIEFEQNPVTKAVIKALPRFFPASLRDGVLHVPPFHTSLPASATTAL